MFSLIGQWSKFSQDKGKYSSGSCMHRHGLCVRAGKSVLGIQLRGYIPRAQLVLFLNTIQVRSCPRSKIFVSQLSDNNCYYIIFSPCSNSVLTSQLVIIIQPPFILTYVNVFFYTHVHINTYIHTHVRERQSQCMRVS